MSKSIAFHNKMRLQRAVLACRDLSDRAKLVFVALIDCLNCQTGRCNPTHAMLAKALGMIPRTIQRGLQELAQAGWFTRKLTRGAPYYSFAFDRMLKEGHTLSPLNGTDGETDQAGWGDKSVAMARPTLSHGTEKNRELKEKRKSDASPSPHNGASVAGPWKPFDPPPESRVSEEERKANLAKLKNVFRHKQGG